MLYLASQSPRRRELLTQIGVRFEVLDVSVPEIREATETPQAYVQRLARDKALAGQRRLLADGREGPVLGADTLGVLDGRVFEKPANKTEAVAMLRALSGCTHDILSAVTVVCGAREDSVLVASRVSFREMAEAEMEAYWATGEPADKAGAYAIQGKGAIFVTGLQGSYSGVVGLPLAETAALLARFGVDLWKS